MTRKWLAMSPWSNKEDHPSASANGSSDGNSSSPKGEEKNLAPRTAPARKETAAAPASDSIAKFEVELSPMPDIYRTAGITNPPKGYSVIKVVEMLQSKHIQGLSQEMKRLAVLMALDAAGIRIEEVLADAKVRQNALNSYEAEQWKLAKEGWAQRAEENAQLEAEAERVKAHYVARVSRNLDGLAREKARFDAWLSLKQQEVQSMTEAVELCTRSPSPEPAGDPVEVTADVSADVTELKTLAKTV